MSAKQPEHIENSIEINASPQRVWEIVSEVRNAPEWASNTARVFTFGRGPGQGVVSVNINRDGLLVWPTTSKIVEYIPGRRIANRINENHSIWAFEIERVGTATRLTERRETPKGTSALSNFLVSTVFGGQEKFTNNLDTGVSTSLQRIKTMAEQG